MHSLAHSPAVVFNVGRPFRKAIWSNWWLLGWLTVLLGFDLYVMFGGGEWHMA